MAHYYKSLNRLQEVLVVVLLKKHCVHAEHRLWFDQHLMEGGGGRVFHMWFANSENSMMKRQSMAQLSWW